MARTHGVTIARDAAIATVVLVGLYVLARSVTFAPLQIPGYLLIVVFDLLELTFGSAGTLYDELFAAYLLGLGLVGAGVAHAVRAGAAGREVSPWRLAVAGALVVIGSISLLFALSILLGTDQYRPALVIGVTGVVALVLAAWLSGEIDVEISRPDGRDR